MVTKAYIQMLEGNRTLTNKSLGKNFWEVFKRAWDADSINAKEFKDCTN